MSWSILFLQVWIQDLVKGGPSFWDGKLPTQRSEQSAAGVQARLRALETFGFLILKYALSHILDTLFL